MSSIKIYSAEKKFKNSGFETEYLANTSAYQIYENIKKGNYPSIGNDFWLIKTNKDSISDNIPYRKIRIISKNAIFKSSYLFGYCSLLSCNFRTIIDHPDSKPNKFLFFISGLRIRTYTPERCADPQPVLNCDQGIHGFAKLSQALKIIERLLGQFEQKPKSRW